MKVCFTEGLLNRAIQDLSQPHPFALERIGYFLGDCASNSGELILAEWFSFEDEYYEQAEDVGARINSAGMKKLMSTALVTNQVFIQFHLHEFQQKPSFSYVDIHSIKQIIPALFNFSSASVHGALIKGSSEYLSMIWFKGNETPVTQHFIFETT